MPKRDIEGTSKERDTTAFGANVVFLLPLWPEGDRENLFLFQKKTEISSNSSGGDFPEGKSLYPRGGGGKTYIGERAVLLIFSTKAEDKKKNKRPSNCPHGFARVGKGGEKEFFLLRLRVPVEL